jgi:uncharacterized protein YndB with AHSA1/START domain
MTKDIPNDPPEPQFIISWTFEAPRDLVFKAWTDPQYIARWWGPKGFTAPVVEVDFRVGGKFFFCMRSPAGNDYWNKGEYREIIVPERIVSVMHFSDAQGNFKTPADYGMGADFPLEMLDVVTFEIVDADTTLLTLRRNHTLTRARQYGEDQGWAESLERLARAVEQ